MPRTKRRLGRLVCLAVLAAISRESVAIGVVDEPTEVKHELSPVTLRQTPPPAFDVWMPSEGMSVLPCEVSVAEGSKFVATTSDPRDYLSFGDELRFALRGQIRAPSSNDTSSPSPSAFPVYTVASLSSDTVVLTEKYTGVTATRGDAWKVVSNADDYIAETRRKAQERLRKRWTQLEKKHVDTEAGAKRRHEERVKREKEERKKKEEEEKRKEEGKKREEARKREEAKKKEEEEKAKEEKSKSKKGEEAGKQRHAALAKREFAALQHAYNDRYGPKPVRQRLASDDCLKHHPRWYCLLKANGMLNGTDPDPSLLSPPVCEDGEQLSGTVDVLQGSPIVYTSANLLGEINTGETIMIDKQRFTVSEPRDAMTLTLSSRFVGAAAKGLVACKVPETSSDVGVVPLPGCVSVLQGSALVRTSQDLSASISNGETMRVLSHTDVVMAPRDARTVTLAKPWPLGTQTCVKAYRIAPTWAAGQVPLPCTVSVTAEEDMVQTSCDMRDLLDVGDLVRIGTHTLAIRGPFTATAIRAEQVWPGQTRSGLKAFKQSRRVRLSGLLTVVNGSRIGTTSIDLRAEVQPGDMVEVANKQYRLVAPIDATEITFAEPYPERSAAHLVAFKVSGTAELVTGCLDVSQGSDRAVSTADLRREMTPGDRVRIRNKEYVLTEPIGADFVSFDTAYAGQSELCVQAFRVGKSAQQLTLEALAREKLKCTSILCLAKIEQQERGLPFQGPRTLGGGIAGAKIAAAQAPLFGSSVADGGAGAGPGDKGGAGGAGGSGGGAGSGGGSGSGSGGGGDVQLTPQFKAWVQKVEKAKNLKSISDYVKNAEEDADMIMNMTPPKR